MKNRVAAIAGGVFVIVLAIVGWRACSGSRAGTSSSASSNTTATPNSNRKARTHTPRGPGKPASLSGRVIDKASGRGIPGAIVSIARAELLEQIMSSGDASTIVTTDAQGAWTASAVLPGTYFVAATADGFLPAARAKLLVDSGETKTGLEIALEAGGSLVSGMVSDIGGGPIADARITVRPSATELDLGGAPDFVAITKADGTFRLTLPDGDYDARATHDDYTSAKRGFELAGEPLTIDFTLTPGGVIRGQVVARDSGTGVAGAWLVADTGRRGGSEGTARTDDTGHFMLRGLAPGAISLRAQGPGYASSAATIVEVGVGEQVDGVRVLVDRAFSISGHVVRKGKTDEGVPGIQLGVFSIGTQQYGLALEPTDDHGAFVIHGLRPASYMLFAGGEGNVPEIGKSVEVVDKDVTDVVVEMATGVTLAGRVDPPQAKVKVTLELTGQVSIINMMEAAKSMLVHGETDDAGTFSVANAPPGAFTLVARAKGGDTGKLPLAIGQTDQRGLVIKLDTRASISGRVVDDKGTPVSDATVDARSQSDDDSNFSFSMGNKGGATTRRDGSFKVVGLEPGKYKLSLRENERNGALKLVNKAAANVEVQQGQPTTGIVLTVEARDGVIRGVVMGSDRKPVADAWVTAERTRPDFKKISEELKDGSKKPTEEQQEEWSDIDWSTSKPVLTGADGRFVIDRLRRGTYKVVADGPRGTSRAEQADVKTGSSVTLTLLSLGTLSGTVTVAGTPVPAYDIACNGPDDDDDDTRAIESPAGTYTLERVAPGAYECTVTADAGTATAKVDVPAGPATLDIALERWGVITGTVVDVLTKKPVKGVLIATSGASFDAKWFEELMQGKAPRTNEAGGFALERVRAGSGSLHVMQRDMTFGKPLATKEYTVKSGERIDLGTIEIVAPRDGDAGTFGFGTTINDGKLFVSSVKADGPAAAAGVKEGDTITSLNGTSVTTLTPEVAQMLVSSGVVGVGVAVRLALDRGGTPVEVSLVSQKW